MSIQEGVPVGGQSLLLRSVWMLGGPVSVIACAAYLAEKHAPFPSVADALFVITAAVVILVRYIDIRRFNGTTADGETRATRDDWRQYAILFGVVSAAVWGVARFITWIAR